MEENEVKVVLLGQSSVGKTCIVGRLISGRFDEAAAPTLGAAYASKTLEISGTTIALQIWDTAGQERFRVLAPMYYRGAHAAILVYSITDDASFTEIDYWVNSVKENAGADVALFLVGNKVDLETNRQVSEAAGAAKAKDVGASFMETSAMTGSGIDDLFRTVAKMYLEQKPMADVDSSKGHPKTTTVKVEASTGHRKKCKC